MITESSKSTIIIVDDEEMVLTSLKSFLDLETEYTVQTFTSAKDALTYIKDHEIDLVVSDYLMPEMDGITFLANVRELRPEVPRIILTGYADKENAIKAMDLAGVNEAYLVLNDYWWKFGLLILQAKAEADEYAEIDNEKIVIFNYKK